MTVRTGALGLTLAAGLLAAAARADETGDLDAWLSRLGSTDIAVAREAMNRLSAVGERVLPMLKAALEHAGEKTPVDNICLLLRRLGPAADTAAPAVEALLPTRPKDRTYLALALAHLAPARARELGLGSDLESCITHASMRLAPMCREAIVRVGGPRAVPFLIEDLHGGDPLLRAWAARMATDAPLKTGLKDALVEALHDRVLDVRVSAASTLLQLGADVPDALPTLLKGVCHGSGLNLNLVTRTLGRSPTSMARAEESLVQAITGVNAECAMRAAAVLAYLRPNRARPAIPLLREALKGSNRDVRWTAALALETMGNEAREALPELDAMALESDQALREAALGARKELLRTRLGTRRVEDVRLVAIAPREGFHVAYLVDDHGRPYQVREGDRLLDGRVESITAEAVQFAAEKVSADYSVTRWHPPLALFDRAVPTPYPYSNDYTGECINVDFDGDAGTFAHLVYLVSGLNVVLDRGTTAKMRIVARNEAWDAIVVRALEDAGLSYQLDGHHVRIRRASLPLAKALSETSTFTGSPLTLTLRGSNPRDLEGLFSDISGLDICFPADARDPITIFVTEVPWDEAFELVLASQGWTYRIDGAHVDVTAAR